MSPQENSDPVRDLLRGEGDCLAPEQLELMLGEGGDAAVRQRFEDHIRGCAACSAELDLLRGFLASKPEPEEESDLAWVVNRLEEKGGAAERAPKRNTSWWQAWGSFSPFSKVVVTLASLLLVVAGALELRKLRVSSPGVADTGAAAVMRSAQLTLIGPSGDVTAIPQKLAWNAVDTAVRYEVLVEEVDGALIWKGESAAAEITLPGPVQSLIVPKKTLVWQVTAFDVRGDKVAESQKQRFRLVP